jgi:Uma2 family endonuclease
MQPSASDGNPDDQPGVLVRHRVSGFSSRWVIPEVPVPEAAWHDRTLELLRALLDHWVARTARDAAVFRNLAVRVRREEPSVGFDPDLCLVEPAPPAAADLSSLKLWEAGHRAPSLVIEVVSPGHPYKDYIQTPDQCAGLGVRELVVFDPLLIGPRSLDGPVRLQLWRRTSVETFDRVAAGEAPVFSEVLGATFVVSEEGRRLRIADDAEGRVPWPTSEEAERAEKERERLEKERALEKVARLRARLGEREG